jgi:hypothetical protein
VLLRGLVLFCVMSTRHTPTRQAPIDAQSCSSTSSLSFRSTPSTSSKPAAKPAFSPFDFRFLIKTKLGYLCDWCRRAKKVGKWSTQPCTVKRTRAVAKHALSGPHKHSWRVLFENRDMVDMIYEMKEGERDAAVACFKVLHFCAVEMVCSPYFLHEISMRACVERCIVFVRPPVMLCFTLFVGCFVA